MADQCYAMAARKKNAWRLLGGSWLCESYLFSNGEKPMEYQPAKSVKANNKES